MYSASELGDPRSAFVKRSVRPPILVQVTVDDSETAIGIRRGLKASRNRLPEHQPGHVSLRAVARRLSLSVDDAWER